MKIALLGYGKMGRLIEQFALNRGHEIVLKISSQQFDQLNTSNLQQADLAIDFSAPHVALDHIDACFKANVPLVMGTTGWYNQLSQIRQACQNQQQTLLYGSNFSVGVNLFYHFNKILAKFMQSYTQYDVQIEEIHHTQKLDSPSGTAITIAEGVLGQIDRKKSWVNQIVGQPMIQMHQADELLIESYRIDETPGTHTVIYSSEIDNIELKHIAHNRNGFALGAVLAAEWLLGKQGFYSIEQVFDFKN